MDFSMSKSKSDLKLSGSEAAQEMQALKDKIASIEEHNKDPKALASLD